MSSTLAQAYIAQRQAEHPWAPPQRHNDLVQAVRQQQGPASAASALPGDDYAALLFARMKPRLPQALQAHFDTGRYAIGTVHAPVIEALMVPLEEGHRAIVFSDRFRQLVFAVARALSTRVVQQDKAPAATTPQFDKTARWIYEIYWWMNRAGLPSGIAHDITQQQLVVACALADAAMAFLIGHELGHIACSDAPHEVPPAVWPTPPETAEQAEEYNADLLGLMYVLSDKEGSTHRDEHSLMIAYAGAELALQVWHAMEVLGIPMGTTHPPFSGRLQALRCALRALSDSEATASHLGTVARCFDEVFANLLTLINDAAAREAHFDAPGARLTGALDIALQFSAQGKSINTDFAYAAWNEVLAKGYPQAICDYLARVGTAFRHRDEEPHPGQRRLIERKFHLIAGFLADDIREPAASVYRAKLHGT